MDKDRIAGSAKDVAGKVESTGGDMAGDAQAQAAGRVREAAGTVQNLYGQAKDAARDAGDADDPSAASPTAALAILRLSFGSISMLVSSSFRGARKREPGISYLQVL